MYTKYQWYYYNMRLLHLEEPISFTTIERVVPIAHDSYITSNIHAECNSESDVLVFMAKLLFFLLCVSHTKEDSGLAMQRPLTCVYVPVLQNEHTYLVTYMDHPSIFQKCF